MKTMHKHLTIIILFILLYGYMHAQIKKQVNEPKRTGYDTTATYIEAENKRENDFDSIIHIPNLKTSDDTFHFRLNSPGQTLDIWTKDYKVFHGCITNYTTRIERYNNIQKRHNGKLYSHQTILNDTGSKSAYDLILYYSILSTPSQERIKGWNLGILDGIGYDIEIATPHIYTLKDYWSPDAQDDTLKEAKQVQTFITSLNKTLKLRDCYDRFIDALPSGRYYYGSGSIITMSSKKWYQRIIPHHLSTHKH